MPEQHSGPNAQKVVLELDGLQWASETSAVVATLGRRPGVVAVLPNAVAQTATVTFDPTRTTLEDLTGWIRDCGYHCRGESVPDHLCSAAPAPAPRSDLPRSAITPEPHAQTTHAGHQGGEISHGQSAPAEPAEKAETDMGAMDHDMGAMETASMAGKPLGHDMAGMGDADRMGSPGEVMGHGGHGEMSMVRDMRNRFLVALCLVLV